MFVLLNAVLEADEHVIVIGPTYQLLMDVPRAIGADVTEVRLRRENGWELDISAVKNALRPNTRLIVANFPHNPTGSLPERTVFEESLHQKIDLMEAAQDASLEERIESDMEFHRTLCQLTGNETLLHSWTALEGSIRMSIMFAGRERASKT